jgi:hypothetical protein
MQRLMTISVTLALSLALNAIAQDLPRPPKPPKSKAGTAEAEREKAADRAAEASPSDGTVPQAGEEMERPLRHEIRPRRIRVNAPFFHLDLDFGGGSRYEAPAPYREAPRVETRPPVAGEAVPAPRADEIPAPRNGPQNGGPQNGGPQIGDDQSWRYRWHDGRWWYWMPSERWVYWDGGRWIGYDQASRPARGFDLRGLNLQDLMQSGEIRFGQPRRGNVELEFENVPRVNIGF